MRKKVIIAFIIYPPLTYLIFIGLGWLFFGMFGGDPTYIIPLPWLIFIFYILNGLILLLPLKLLKLYTPNNYIAFLFEAALVYIILWVIVSGSIH